MYKLNYDEIMERPVNYQSYLLQQLIWMLR